MGKRKEAPLPQINGEPGLRRSSRPHNQRANYQEVSSDYDSDDSRDVPFRETEVMGSDRNLVAEDATVSLIASGALGPGKGENAATCTSNAAKTTGSGRGRGRGGRGNIQSGCGTRGLVEGENASMDLIGRGTRGSREGERAATCTSNASETTGSGRGCGRGGRGNIQSGCGTRGLVEGENASMDLIARGRRGAREGESAATCTSNVAETTGSGRGRGRAGRGNIQSGCGTRGLVEGENAATCARSGGGRGRGGRGSSQSGRDGEKEERILRWLTRGRRTIIPQRREGSPPPPPPSSPAPEQMSFSGKKTILSWLINHKLVKEGEEVCYYVDGKPRRAGRVTKGGIICSCCQREISVWDFEKHARSGLRQPYKCICLQRERQNNPCLQHLQIAAWQKPMESKRRTMFSYVPKEIAAHPKDDTCSICGDGGDLICCEKCPSTNHPSCINMESVPHTNWFCPYCICKFCGLGVLSKDFITCRQCDKKFHWECFMESEKDFLRETLDASSFLRLYCGPDCRKIYEKSEGSLGVIPDNSASYSWRVVCPMDMISTASEDSYIEKNSKVAVAGMLMSEIFHSITDRCTGIDMVQSVVYSRGSNLNRINFSRFYTFILEKNDEMIAAASVRIHGKEIAEMPFIATDVAYRGQGNCQMLMKAIESFLRDLNVENLIIPSTVETVEMWKQKYSFNDVNNELKRTISMYNTLMFPWAVRLFKDLKGITGSGRADENDISNGQEQAAQEEGATQTDTQNSVERERVQAAQTDRCVRLYLDLNVGLDEQNTGS